MPLCTSTHKGTKLPLGNAGRDDRNGSAGRACRVMTRSLRPCAKVWPLSVRARSGQSGHESSSLAAVVKVCSADACRAATNLVEGVPLQRSRGCRRRWRDSDQGGERCERRAPKSMRTASSMALLCRASRGLGVSPLCGAGLLRCASSRCQRPSVSPMEGCHPSRALDQAGGAG